MLIGIIGKPSSGKSTFFKAATLIDVAIAAYPFTTITPNRGAGYVRVKCVDRELGVQCNPMTGYCENGIRYVPVELLDVAGLVPGAHEGRGLGNQFLSDLNRADVLIHVLDISGSANEKGEISVPNSYDPANDVRFLEHELDMWYLGILKKGWNKFSRKLGHGKTAIEDEIASQMSSFDVKRRMVEEALTELKLNKDEPTKWTDEELLKLAIYFRRRTKPIIIACNKIDIPGADKNYERLKKEFPDYYFVPCSAESELALREAAKHGLIKYNPGDSDFEILQKDKLNEKQLHALEFVKNNVLKKFGSTGIQKTLDSSVFDFLKFVAIFPGGVNKLSDKEGRVLPDCFLMPPNTTALDFANKIHTDLGNNFLYAIDVRTKMKIRGDHKLKSRDIIEIVSASK